MMTPWQGSKRPEMGVAGAKIPKFKKEGKQDDKNHREKGKGSH